MRPVMKKLMLTAAALALTLGTAGAVQAADAYNGYDSSNHDSWYNWNNNVYLSIGGGWNYQNSQEFKAKGRDKVDFDSGYVGEVAVGHTWWNTHFGDTRTELEGSYRYNDVDTIKGTGGGGSRGEFNTWDALLNEYYDFHTGTSFTPYVGAGVGVSFQNARHIGPAFAPGGSGISDSTTQLAYQGIVGVDYWTTKRSAFGVRYDYLGTSRGKFDSTVGDARNEGTNNHAVLVTYRYNWGVETAAPEEPHHAVMPAAAPEPMTQTTTTIAAPTEQQIEDSPYKIFFANNSAKLTNNAQQVIADAATAAGDQHAVVLQLTSNTDTTGSKKLNDRLSEKRAKAVRAALVGQGVSPDKISIISNAERDLPVPTGPGVKEPRNRVVTIVLQ